MATLTRSNSRVNPPMYKDYVNFLASYKNGKKEEENSDSGISTKNFSSSSSSSSISSITSDVTDFSRNSCTPFNSYLENSKNKKFSSVKPNFEEKKEEKNNDVIEKKEEKNNEVAEKKCEEKREKTMKSEIFIEIQPTKSVSEVSKIFEISQKKPPPKSNKLNSKINIFERQIENKPKIAHKPSFKSAPPPKIDIFKDAAPKAEVVTPPPKPQETFVMPPPPPLPQDVAKTASPPQNLAKMNTPSCVPPPPPPPAMTPPKLQATLTKGPQTKYTVNNPNGVVEIDRNNPLVKKLVYGTLRGLYGAYHDQASDMLATLPKNMVVRSNGVQDRIEQIAANGDLEKLNGRINPKTEE